MTTEGGKPKKAAAAAAIATYTGYCMKCKAKKTMHNGEEFMEKSRRVAKGTCPECKTKMFAFLPKKV